MNSGKKKVLYISPNGYLGGAERVVLTLSRAHLHSKDFEPVILFFSNGEAVKEAKAYGIKCHVLDGAFKLSRPLSLVRALLQIRRIIKQENPDLLHHTMAYAHLTTSMATLGLGIKKVWFQHGPVGQTLDKLASLFPVDFLFFNSAYLKDLHHQSFPKVHIKKGESIIKLGVQSNEFQHNIFSSPMIHFGTAGRITRFKAFDQIIKTIGEIKVEGSARSFKLLIAGTAKTEHDKIYFEELKTLVNELNLSEEVIFLGHVEEMNKYYSKIDAFIHASIQPEPFGLVVAEAMAQGCLTIGCKQGGVADFLIDHKTGLTYSSATSIAQTDLKIILKTLLNSQGNLEEYKNIARSGQTLIQNEYNVDRMREQVENLYREIT